MDDPRIAEAQSELEAIDLHYVGLLACIDFSHDPRRIKATMKDGTTVALQTHVNKRKKALRDWLRKWGPHLRKAGYQVASYEEIVIGAVFKIEEIPADDDGDAQIEKEKYKKVFNPKSKRSNRLRNDEED